MDAVTLIEQAQSLGLTLSVDGDNLNITGPKTLAAAALVQRMAPCKADIVAALMLDAEVAQILDDGFVPAQLPPLPAELWRTGFATFAEARRYQRSITSYRTACGRGADGFYVAGPNSGLCAVRVLYVEATDEDIVIDFGEVNQC